MKGFTKANKFKIFAGILTIILLGVAFFASKTNINKTNSLETAVNNAATINTNWNPNGMGITSEAILRRGVINANANKRYDNGGCVQFTNELIKEAVEAYVK